MQADNIKFVPSYLFSAIDYETMQMSRELDLLGGGDACTKQYEVHVVYTPFPWSKTLPPSSSSSNGRSKYGSRGAAKYNTSDKDAQVIWASDKSLGLRDVLQARHSSSEKSMRYFRVTSTTKLSDILLSPDERSFPVIREASKWLLDGFNGCIFALGERASGKTLALYGPSPPATVIARSMESIVSSAVPYSQDIAPSAVLSILKHIYVEVQDEQDKPDGDVLTVALSCWLVRGQHAVDLLAPLSGGADSSRPAGAVNHFEAVECPSLSTAMQVVSVARNRAPGVLALEQAANDCERGHYFTRIIVHRRIRSTFSSHCGRTYTSHLHIVDLLGSCIVENDLFNKMVELNRIARRDHMLSLQALSKVLSQIKSLSKAGIPSGPVPIPSPPISVTSARESRLTAILAPLLQGNVRVFAVGFLRDGEQHHQQSSATMQTLNGLCEVTSACHRVEGVSLQSLRLRGFDYLLSPFLMTAVPFVFGSASSLGDDDGAAISAAKDLNEDSFRYRSGSSHTPHTTIAVQLPTLPWMRQHQLPPPDPMAISDEFDAIMSDRLRDGFRLSGTTAASFEAEDAVAVAAVRELAKSESNFFPAAAPPRRPPLSYSVDALQGGYGAIANPSADSLFFNVHSSSSSPSQSAAARRYNNTSAIDSSQIIDYDSTQLLDVTIATDAAIAPSPRPRRDQPPTPEASSPADNTFDEDSLEGSVPGTPSSTSPIAANTNSVPQVLSPIATSPAPSPEKKKDMKLFKGLFKSLVGSILSRRNNDTKSAPEGASSNPSSPPPSPSRAGPPASPPTSPNPTASQLAPPLQPASPLNDVTDARPAPSPSYIQPPRQPAADTFNELRLSFNEQTRGTSTPDQSMMQLSDKYNLLLSSLDAEHKRRVECEDRMKKAEDEAREHSIQHELIKDDANEAISKLKLQIKNLCDGHNLGDVFARFESDVRRLASENELLRRRNLLLECKEVDAFSKAPPREPIASARGVGSSSDGGRSARLASQIKKTKQENDILKHQIEELRTSERHSLLSIKLAQDSNLRLRNTSIELQRAKEQLQVERSARLGREKEVSFLQEEMKTLLHSDTHYRGERERLISEVATLRARVRDFNFMQQQSLQAERQSTGSTLAGSAGILPATAGSFDAQYVRLEEAGAVGERVSASLSRLHEGIIAHCPSLLPIFKDHAEAIYRDKDTSLSQSRELLGKLYSRQYESTAPPGGKASGGMRF